MRRPESAARARILSLSFLLPTLLALGAFAVMGLAPFGEKSVLIMDMSDQYIEFLCGLKNGDVYFSWSKSLGTGYVGVFAYYVASPLSALTLLVPNEAMPVGVLFLTALKIGLCGLSFAALLLYRFGGARTAVIPFAAAYGLMSYNIAYSMCIMWLDGVFWLPIILIGTERILEGKSQGLLAAALLVSFLSNYYISYMSGLFTALYFIWRLLEQKKPLREWKRPLARFALGAVTAAALGAFFLLPTALSLFQGKLDDVRMDYAGLTNFSLPAFFLKLLPGSFDSITNSGAPFVYCGLPALALFVVFFFKKGTSPRDRLLTGGFALLLLLSLFFSPLDKVWHVFQYPNFFPHRYSFVLTLLVLLTAYRTFCLMKWQGRRAQLVLTLFFVVDLSFNAIGILHGLDRQFGYHDYAAYRDHKIEVQQFLQEIGEEEGLFYRVGATAERSKNEPIGFGYAGITHYSSAYNQSVNRFQSHLGFAQAYFWNSYFGSTPVMDAILSVRYIMSDREMPPGYEIIGAGPRLTLYRNDAALAPAFRASESELAAFSQALDSGTAPFVLQNNLLRALAGTEEDCFVSVAVQTMPDAGAAVFELVSDGRPLYALFDGSSPAWLYVNGEPRMTLFTNETNCIQYIGAFAAGETVTLRVETPVVVTVAVCAFDTDVWDTALAALAERQLLGVSVGSHSLAGTLPAGAGDLLVTTIPFEPGWSARIDGVPVKTQAFADTFLAVPLTEEAQELQFVYTAQGLPVGIAISLLSLALVAVGLMRGKRKRASACRKT